MVTINGKQEQAAGMTVLAYLEQAGYTPERVVVEKNLEIIPRESLDNVILLMTYWVRSSPTPPTWPPLRV